MKPGLTAKLFLAVLAACALVLLVNGVAARMFFQRAFFGYLNDQGVERMQEVLPRLGAEYATHGSWDFVRDNPSAWFALMRPERRADARPRAPSISDQTGAVPRFAVLDRDYRVLVGNPAAGRDSILRPIDAGGRVVGWMAMVPFQRALGAGDARFFAAQVHAWWMIGSASVLVAALLAWLLSRTLLRRMRGLALATHRLAAGDYTIRIDAGGHDELGQLARDFNQLAAALEHNERARRGFMADISHELRTPLAVLRAELEAMQDGIRQPTADTLAALDQQVRQLGKLVDDLHDLSLTDVGALAYRRTPIDLATVLETAVSGMRGRFADAGLVLQADAGGGPLPVLGDERRLHQLFANLLENALRYTDAPGRVHVGWRRQDGQADVRVEDTAPGVEPARLPHLFQRFYRAEDSRNRASGGSGLGLAIGRNIVEAHGGRIDATPSPLGGLRITVHLPLRETP